MLRSFRTIRNIPRLKDISFILIKHGLYQIASFMGAPIRFRLRRFWPGPSRAPLSQAARLRLAFQELGPLFIK
ncbi:MAG: ubiquinone biosynthesis protein UbiB, partial [Planctomycetota bacterium]